MKKFFSFWRLALRLRVAVSSRRKSRRLRLVQTIDVPGARKWDHFGVDLKGNRLFVTSEEEPAVEVFDLQTDKHLRNPSRISRNPTTSFRSRN